MNSSKNVFKIERKRESRARVMGNGTMPGMAVLAVRSLGSRGGRGRLPFLSNRTVFVLFFSLVSFCF